MRGVFLGEGPDVRRRDADGGEHQNSASEDKSEADGLVSEQTAVFGYAPNAIECDFKRQEDAIGREQQKEDRKPTEFLVGVQQIISEIDAEAGGEIIVHGTDDDVYGGLRMQDRFAQQNHCDQKRKERDEDIGGHGEGIHVHFGFHKKAQGRRYAVPEASPGAHADTRCWMKRILRRRPCLARLAASSRRKSLNSSFYLSTPGSFSLGRAHV